MDENPKYSQSGSREQKPPPRMIHSLPAKKLGARSFRSAKFEQSGSLALPLFYVVFGALLLSAQTFASPTLQFIGKDFTHSSDGATWMSTSRQAAWRSAHSATNGWTLPEKFGGAVWFDGAGAVSPMEFGADAAGAVSHVFAVVECADGADFATLFDAPCPVRFRGDAWSDAESVPFARELERGLLARTNSIAINGEETFTLSPSAKLQLVEARFDEAAALDSVFIGGSPAHSLWGRGWRGGIAELVLFADTPSERELNAARRYLAVKFKIAAPTESDNEIVPLLAELGIDDFGVFNTVISVR